MLWTFLGNENPAVKNVPRRLQYVKALERLLLTSAAGALFFALARYVPVHAQEFTLPPDWPYTLDRLLRYLCLLWFLAYFFVSSTNNDLSDVARRRRHIVFEFVQSVSVLAAMYSLGFVLPERGFGFNDGLSAFLFSNLVVAFICILSLLLFSDGASTGLTRVRLVGLVLAVISALIAWRATRGTGILAVLLVLQLLLWMVWWAYLSLILDQAPSKTTSCEANTLRTAEHAHSPTACARGTEDKASGQKINQ